jgi:hypothetical protein
VASLTATIAKIVYVIIMIGIGLTYLVFVLSAFSRNAAAGLFVLVVFGPITTQTLAVMRGQGPTPPVTQGYAGPPSPPAAPTS